MSGGLRDLVEQALNGISRTAPPSPPKVDPAAQARIARMRTVKTQQDADSVFEAIKSLVQRSLAPLEARIAELEPFPFEYVGTYEPQKFYSKNAVVTDAGSLWIALCSTEQRPGHGDDWQLCVKRGPDQQDDSAARIAPRGHRCVAQAARASCCRITRRSKRRLNRY